MNVSKANLGFSGNYCIQTSNEKNHDKELANRIHNTANKMDHYFKESDSSYSSGATSAPLNATVVTGQDGKVYITTSAPQFSGDDLNLFNSSLLIPNYKDIYKKVDDVFKKHAETQGWIG